MPSRSCVLSHNVLSHRRLYSGALVVTSTYLHKYCRLGGRRGILTGRGDRHEYLFLGGVTIPRSL